MNAQLAAAVALTRPAQWPVLSVQLGVGLILGRPAAGDGAGWAQPAATLGLAWTAWVVALNGGTLAFNSAYDRDLGPVAYLARPPQPPRWLAAAALALMAAGAVLGLIGVGPAFGALTGACVLLSVLYSHPRFRWKSRPGLDLAVNMAGYGAGTTAAGILAARAAWPQAAPGSLPAAWGWIVAAFGLLFGALYPLTQIYQIDQDRARGDRGLAVAVGARRALLLAMALNLAAWAAAARGLALAGRTQWWPLPAAAALAWTLHLAGCLRRVQSLRDEAGQRAMYGALWLWALADAALAAAWVLG